MKLFVRNWAQFDLLFSVLFLRLHFLFFFICPSFSDNRLILVNFVDLFSCTVTCLFLFIMLIFALQCLSVHMSFFSSTLFGE